MIDQSSPEDRAFDQIVAEWDEAGIDYPADARERIEKTFDFQRRVLAIAWGDLCDAIRAAMPFKLSARTMLDRAILLLFFAAAVAFIEHFARWWTS